MIVKQISCDSCKAGILYAGHKMDAELVASNNCFGSPNDIADQFIEVQAYNTTTADKNKTYHVAIGWNAEDHKKLNELDKKQIAESFATKLGFTDRQWVCYEHHDGNAPHMHFIGNRIGIDGKSVSLSLNYYRHEEFCRQQEKKYDLTKVKTKSREHSKVLTQSLSNHRKEELKGIIDKHIKKSKSFKEFTDSLEKSSIKVYKGRGLSYLDKDNVKFKASALGREYSLKNTEKRIEQQRNKELSL